MTPKQLKQIHPVLAVRDVSKAIAYYTDRLGFRYAFSDDPNFPRYAGVRRDDVEIHLQWHDESNWIPGQDRPVIRIVVEDVDALFAELQGRGLSDPRSVVRDTPWGTREFHVQDPDGNGLQFYVDR